jgi:hypothetical protein
MTQGLSKGDRMTVRVLSIRCDRCNFDNTPPQPALKDSSDLVGRKHYLCGGTLLFATARPH